MEYKVEDAQGMRFIGMERRFAFESAFEEIPKFWDEFCRKSRNIALQWD